MRNYKFRIGGIVLLFFTALVQASPSPLSMVFYMNLPHAELHRLKKMDYDLSFDLNQSRVIAVSRPPFSVAKTVSTKKSLELIAVLAGHSSLAPNIIISLGQNFLVVELTRVIRHGSIVHFLIHQFGLNSHSLRISYNGRVSLFIDDVGGGMDLNMGQQLDCESAQGYNSSVCFLTSFIDKPNQVACLGYGSLGPAETVSEKIASCSACGGTVAACVDEYKE